MNPNNTGSSYQPFLIGQGTSKTGLFNYVESWVKPEDAFDRLDNAYVYRGSIYQRQGMALFPSTKGAGALVYKNNEIADFGDTGTSYGGTISNFPIIGTVTITALTGAGKLSSQATGTGVVNWTGVLAVAGSIDFDTGIWTITTTSAVATDIPIVISYTYVPTNGNPSINNPIMGIKLHQNATTNTQTLVVMDTRRASFWSTATKSFEPLSTISQIVWVSDGVTTDTGAVTLLPLQWTNIAPYTVTISGGGDTINDVPLSGTDGDFTSMGNLNPANSHIQYNFGTLRLTFVVAPPTGTRFTITASLQDDYFTGNNTNFFNATNWQTTDGEPSYLYMTNNVDFVTLFDGTNLSSPPFAIVSTNMILDSVTLAPLYPKKNDFQNVLDIKVYKNRLLFIRPTLLLSNVDAQSIRWSKIANVASPLGNFNFVADVAGNGGELSAPTGDWIQSSQFLRDMLIVLFQNSTWLFRFTGNVPDVFRFDKTNGSRSTNAPYGSVEYDDVVTSMGAKGLIACNGVEVERYDDAIIDFIENINQNSFGQCFAQKFDTTNQTFMLYPSEERENATSDSILIYNFLEKTWAIFRPNLGLLIQDPNFNNTLSCLGLGFTTEDLRWLDFAVGSGFYNGSGLKWSQATYSWNSFQQQDLAPSLLGGDQNGFVYEMLNGPTDDPGPEGTEPLGIQTDIITKRFNPFRPLGQKARFGYLDIYYEINREVQVTFNFYLNNSTVASLSKLITLDGPDNNIWAWKRIYVSVVAEFLQVQISSIIGTNDDGSYIFNTTGVFKILGMILYAAPSGRLTPGTFL